MRSENRVVLYRRDPLTREDVCCFVRWLFDEAIRTNIQYDLVTKALVRSGITPLPSVQCRGEYLDVRQESVNALTDVFFSKLRASLFVYAVASAVAKAVLNDFTTPAPRQHLTQDELHEDQLCSSAEANCRVEGYDLYAAQHAHIGTCVRCDRRLRELAGHRA